MRPAYSSAAEQGQVGAQSNLGVMYDLPRTQGRLQGEKQIQKHHEVLGREFLHDAESLYDGRTLPLAVDAIKQLERRCACVHGVLRKKSVRRLID